MFNFVEVLAAIDMEEEPPHKKRKIALVFKWEWQQVDGKELFCRVLKDDVLQTEAEVDVH